MPFRQFLLKVHSRCNLACDHCYVYALADQSWRSKPRVMSVETVRRTAQRIGEHARRHRLSEVRVVLHGGEPLLVGPDRIADVATAVRGAVGPGTRVELSVQTNGLLLDPAMLDVLAEHRVRVGVSIDGDREANDRHRRHRDGRSSYDGLSRALALLDRPEYRHLYGGLLCTVDVANDPVRTYEALIAHRPPAIDLLLPNANWTSPPPGRSAGAGDRYAQWLVAVFDRWYSAPRQETSIRLFEEIIALLLGGRSATEAVGLTPVDLVVVETDGAPSSRATRSRARSTGRPRPGSRCTGTRSTWRWPTPASGPGSRGWPACRPTAGGVRWWRCAAAGSTRTATSGRPASTTPRSTPPTSGA